jgi:hypothetical protein
LSDVPPMGLKRDRQGDLEVVETTPAALRGRDNLSAKVLKDKFFLT